jgi:hypothetical protein
MLSGEIMVSPGRFGSRDRSLGGVNLVIYDHVDNVNSRRVKLARQRLTEHPQRPLSNCQRRETRTPPQRGSGACQ